MTGSRIQSEPIYVPESIPIPETVAIMQKRGKLNLHVKGQPSPEELQAQINPKGPASTAKDLKPGDEFDGAVSVLPVRAIHPYDRNPRTSPNPKFHEIKASIRERGALKTQLAVTKRPTEPDRYMLYMGGNTRLQIIKELFAETGDPRFAQVSCIYHKWISEADVLASHLIENEARGDTLFIEKARGLTDLAREIGGDKGLTARELQARTAKMGMVVNRSTILLYDFSVRHLQPIGPWLTRENVNQMKRRFDQHAAAAEALNREGEFTQQYPTRLQRYLSDFAATLEVRQLHLRESGDQTLVGLRGDSLGEVLRGFDRALVDALVLDAATGKRLLGALDSAPKEGLSVAGLSAVLAGAPASEPTPPSATAPAMPAPTASAGAPPDWSPASQPSRAPPRTDASGSMPARPVAVVDDQPAALAPVHEDRRLPNAQPVSTDPADQPPSAPPPPIALGEVLTPERLHAFGLWFFGKLKTWCDVTRIVQWLEIRDDLDLPYLFWIELPEEISTAADKRLDDAPDPEFGTLEPGMLRVRSSAYRLVALLSGQLGGVIEGEGGAWSNEADFAQRLPAGSPWRAAALVDYMSIEAFYNVWEDQMGGVTFRRTCQLGLAPHDLLSVLHDLALAETWTDLTTAYLLWGEALALWRAQAPNTH
jgi:ParB family protein of integrating conjugative element (PFGI_1 class)